MAEDAVRRRQGALASLANPFDDLARKLGDRPVRGIIDAGAARGSVSRLFASRFPDTPILAIDPNPDRRDDLQRLEASLANVEYCPVALGREPGRLSFHRTEDPNGASLLPPLSNRDGRVEINVKAVEEVEVTSLDALCEAKGFVPEIVKLDLQGNERDAILGAERSLREQARAVHIEALFEPLYEGASPFAELDGLLREMGFGLFQFYETNNDPDGRLMWADAVYFRGLGEAKRPSR
ncbi:MAG: hypothetical protein DHS20C14_21700 [Phycisphaeraceae bacterium]|nr:MAG: hypothetical protein DHS20C14_21700 [Phycisphaeraceae bacterium]